MGLRVALAAVYPLPDGSSPRFALSNYGVRRILAALSADPALADVELRLFESRDRDAEALAARIEAFDPDIVGGSAYIWSLPTLLGAARRLSRPGRRIVLGGPSARPEMFARSPYREGAAPIDALVIGPGERAFRAIVAGRPPAEVPGLAIPAAGGWHLTGDPGRAPPIEETASPYQLGLAEPGGFASLQSYFGCPLSCSYCAWGAMGDARDVLSAGYLARELRAFQALGARGALLVDAALNLNPHAFRSLAAAEAEVGFFRGATLLCELYPSRLSDEHLRFLDGLRRPQVSVGLQSYDPEVLARMGRPFDPGRFEERLRRVAGVAEVIVELILGLPGDSPESFRRSFERLLELPVGLRVYPCLALPDALMAQAPPHFALRWDPQTLKLRSCWGWSAAALERTAAWVSDRAAALGGTAGTWWWSFDRFEARAAGRAARPGAERARPVSAALGARLSRAVAAGSGGRWRAGSIRRRGDRIEVVIAGEGGGFTLWMCRALPGRSRYRELGALAFGYSGEPPGSLPLLDRVIARIAGGM